MTATTNRLDASYQARALPLGSARYFSHLFAAAACQGPLLGLYALGAEWQALTDPAIERAVVEVKLGWWQEELARLMAGSGVHPISRYLSGLPGATPATFAPLKHTLEATLLEAGGVPLERRADLAAHANALLGVPLGIVAALSGAAAAPAAFTALACGEYLSHALRDYRRAAARGKIVFAVDELLSAGIENAALTAATAPPALANYLASLKDQALEYFAAALDALPPRAHAAQRHLLVLATLGSTALRRSGDASPKRALLQDMLIAWRAARRAARTVGD